jgi:hypothetical protein
MRDISYSFFLIRSYNLVNYVMSLISSPNSDESIEQ